MNKTDHAVVVGISRYGSLRPELEGPERDAKEFASWLTSASGGHLPPGNVRVILSSDFPNPKGTDPFVYEPTAIRVTAAFARLMGIATKNFGRPGARVGRRLYIYFAGHGLTPEIDVVTSTNQSALAMANCVQDTNFYEYVVGTAYAEWFRLSHAFDEILLFMDCCRDDRPEIRMMTPITTAIVGGGRPQDVKTFYAFATQWDSRSYEMPLGPKKEKRGVFTYALIEALTSGTPDAQGRLTPLSIVGHLSKRVPELRNGDSSQSPQFIPPIPDDSIVLVSKTNEPAKANLTLRFAASLVGQQMELQNGSFKTMATEVVTANPMPFKLPPGVYVVRINGKDWPGIPLRPNEVKEEKIDG